MRNNMKGTYSTILVHIRVNGLHSLFQNTSTIAFYIVFVYGGFNDWIWTHIPYVSYRYIYI